MINQERLIKTLCDLITIDSPSGEERNIGEQLIKRLEALGVKAEFDSYGNVIGKIGGKDPILLSAHMDTVEPGRGIKPRIEESRIVSEDNTILGGDCKAGIAAILEGITSIQEDGESHMAVELAFTRQEEIGLVGAQNLDYSKFESKEAIVFDGEGPVTQVTSSSPTHVGFEIDVRGRAAHAGVEPEKGISAIRIAAEIITKLPQGRIDDETTFNIGTINGGSVRNAVPENAKIHGEFRSHNKNSLEGLKLTLNSAIEEIRNGSPEAEIELKIDTHFEAYSVSESQPSIKRVQKALISLDLECNLIPSGGGTDGNIFRSNGIDAAVVGMADHNAHTVREYIEIDELLDVAKLCDKLLRIKI